MARRNRATATAKPAARRSWLDRSSPWLVPAGVLAITFLTFLPALHGQFVTWDDDRNFVMNMSYRGLGWAELRWMWTTFLLGPYQPLSWMTLGFDYVVWGMDPYGYHLTNLLLHTVNAGLLYVLARKLYVARTELQSATPGRTEVRSALRTDLAAGVAALVFAIHPLRVESVAWVTERRDVLSGFFALLTMIAYLNGARGLQTPGTPGLKTRGSIWSGWLIASVGLFALSLLSKASAMALPAALIVIDIWLLRRNEPGPRNPNPVPLRTLLIEKIPFAALGIAATVVAAIGQRTVDVLATMDRQGPLQRIARAFYGLVFYIWKSLVPIDLSNLYEVPFRANAFDIHFILSAVAVVAITVATFLLRKRWPAVFVAWMTYALLLLPVSGIAHGGGQIVADRYSYIPCLSLALLAGGAVVAWQRATADGRRRLGPPQLFAVVPLVVLLVLAGMTSAQISVWHDSTSLWQNAFALHPIERLRRAGAARDDERRAYEATVSALGNMSAYWAICYNLGTTLRTTGRIEEAVEIYGRGAAVNPVSADVRNSWAAALMDLHRYDEAIPQLDAAIAIEPTHAKAYYNLGIARAGQGRTDDAIAAYRHSIAIDPGSAEPHYNLGVLLAGRDDLEEAAAEYRRAIALRPDYAEAYNNLGVALGRQGRTREAIDAFRQAVTLDPANEGARQNLAKALTLLKGGT